MALTRNLSSISRTIRLQPLLSERRLRMVRHATRTVNCLGDTGRRRAAAVARSEVSTRGRARTASAKGMTNDDLHRASCTQSSGCA